MAGHFLSGVALCAARGKKDIELEDPGMDALGENVYSHISFFSLPKVLACWNSVKETD